MNLRNCCACGLMVASYLLGQSATGSIQGSVRGDDGTPLTGVQIQYRRLTESVYPGHNQVLPAPGEAVADSSVTSDSSGNFTAPNLLVGSYLLCAEAASLPYLNPCKWSAPLQLTVAANATAVQPLVLRKGVFLKVRVNDPLSLLPSTPDSPLGGGPLVIGVMFGTGAFLGAANTQIDSTGRDYQMAIPAGVPLKLWVASSRVTLVDGTGTPVISTGGAATVPFQAAAGVDQLFTFTPTPLAVSAQAH